MFKKLSARGRGNGTIWGLAVCVWWVKVKVGWKVFDTFYRMVREKCIAIFYWEGLFIDYYNVVFRFRFTSFILFLWYETF